MNTPDDRRTPAVHKIRLGSQWDFEALPNVETPHDPLPGGQRLKHLSDYTQAAGAEFKGRIRLVRRFGRPTGLTPNESVALVGIGCRTAMTISLNDQILKPLQVAKVTVPGDAPNAMRFDVTNVLQEKNRLAIEFDMSENPGARGVIVDVRLEIFVGAP